VGDRVPKDVTLGVVDAVDSKTIGEHRTRFGFWFWRFGNMTVRLLRRLSLYVLRRFRVDVHPEFLNMKAVEMRDMRDKIHKIRKLRGQESVRLNGVIM
jgi:hypothetical protein